MRQKVCVDLIHRIQNGDETAKTELIIECKPWVEHACKRYSDEFTALYDYDDMVQDCLVRLLDAANKYDDKIHSSFQAYLYYYILRVRQYSFSSRHIMRVPLEYAKDEHFNTVSFDSLHSIDNSIGKQDRISIKETIEDENVNLFSCVLSSELKDALINALSNLSEKNAEIIIRRYGLDGREPMTLEDVAKLFNVTRERIRQREIKSLRQLRRYVREYKDYLY